MSQRDGEDIDERLELAKEIMHLSRYAMALEELSNRQGLEVTRARAAENKARTTLRALAEAVRSDPELMYALKEHVVLYAEVMDAP